MRVAYMIGFALLIVAAAVAALMGQAVVTPIPAIQTEGGMIAGQVLESGVKAWLGVPFAKPPTNDLRWMPPQPMTWKGTWNADRKMPECMQVLRPHNINHYFGEEATSEDCLYLNIWAPGNSTANSRLLVIVFIYGGGGTIGSSGMAIYGGENIARRNAVFVNFNYRVGVLGFLAHPELTKEQGGHSGNYAYLDQNAALKWIHNNISRFGGDPAKVVIIGQSAGASSVTQQLLSPLSKGLFRGAVMSSGCNWSGTSVSLADGERNGLEIQKRLGAATLADMRNIPADRIIDIQNENQVGTSVQGVRATGVIDGYFLPRAPMEILQAREMNDVPIIASFNRDEAASPLQNAKTVAEYNETARRLYGPNADAFLKLYPVQTVADIRRVGGQVAREAGLARNARDCAMLQTQFNRSRVYIDMFSRKHSYAAGVKIADQDPVTIGAYHTADIPYWFGNLDVFNMFRKTRDWQAWDRQLSERMMASLIAFADTGNPATADVKWPAWSPTDEAKVEFGDTISVVKLNVEGISWLKAHPAQVTGGGPPRTGPVD